MFKLANLIGYGGLALLAIAVLCLAGWLGGSCQRQRTAKAVHTTEASHDARAAAEPAKRSSFDSTFFSLAGQHREAVRTGLLPQKHYDSLHRLFPAAVPELPAQPARYRPSH